MTKRWYMTDNEIKRSWRCAINKRDQIGILAELNCKTKLEVEQKLADLGLDIPGNRKGKPTKIDEAAKRRLWQLRQNGNTFQQIAAMMEGKPSKQAVMTAFKKMTEERTEARPVLIKALKDYMRRGNCTESERDIIKTWIARGI